MHTAGERVFVDFTGHTMEVIDGANGEIHRAEVFVAVLGASSYVFAQATWTQSLPTDCGSRQHAGVHRRRSRARSSATICVPGPPGLASTSRWSSNTIVEIEKHFYSVPFRLLPKVAYLLAWRRLHATAVLNPAQPFDMRRWPSRRILPSWRQVSRWTAGGELRSGTALRGELGPGKTGAVKKPFQAKSGRVLCIARTISPAFANDLMSAILNLTLNSFSTATIKLI